PACPNPEEQRDEVEFGHPPIKPGKFGKPDRAAMTGRKHSPRPWPGLRTQAQAQELKLTTRKLTLPTARIPPAQHRQAPHQRPVTHPFGTHESAQPAQPDTQTAAVPHPPHASLASRSPRRAHRLPTARLYVRHHPRKPWPDEPHLEQLE